MDPKFLDLNSTNRTAISKNQDDDDDDEDSNFNSELGDF